MKLLTIIDDLNLGGAENLVSNILPIMKSYNIEPELLVLSKRETVLEDKLKNNQIPIHYTGLHNIYSVRQIKNMAHFINNNKQYEIVHVHLFPAQYFFVLARFLSHNKVPAVTTEHSTFNKRRSKPFLRIIEKYIFAQYETIICISRPAENEFLKWLPSLNKKTKVVYNGIDYKKFNEARPYKRSELIPLINPGAKLILMVASITPKKDHKTVIKAVNKLPSYYHVLFVGDGPKLDVCKAMVKSYDLSNRVHFLGFRNDVERIMKTADLFVLSSHWEGFGLVAAEAMASGLPVITSNVPGLSEVVNEAGILFKAGDEEVLAKLIKEVMNSGTTYEYYRTRGLERAKQFSLERTVNDYIKVYRSVLGIKDSPI